MKVLRQLKSKKILKSVLKGSLKTNVFLILLGIFFSTLAFAAALTVTWEAAIIPGGNNHFSSDNPGRPFSCKASLNGKALTKDRTEDPNDVAFSDDGLTVFTSNATISALGDNHISQNRLDRPFDVSSDRVRFNPAANCDDLDALDSQQASGNALNQHARSIDVVDNGKIFFVLDGFGQLGKFNAVAPNDVDGVVYETKISFSVAGGDTTGDWAGDQFIQNVAFSRDGTKLYTLTTVTAGTQARQLSTFSLPGPFDISSYTLVHQVDFFDIGVIDDSVTEIGRGIEFSSDGSALYLLVGNTNENVEANLAKNYIYQFSLSKNFDISTATKVGRLQLGTGTFLNRTDNQSGMPRGFTFASDGMKLFVLDNRAPDPGVDQINQFRLECPFGVVACVSNPTASISSQVELAKQNITLNISSIFYRFEWIKRNRDEENFTSHNININYPNPLLKSLAMSLEPAIKKKIVTLVNTPKKDQKKSKWSSWSLGDLSLSNFDKLGFENAKSIRTEGITFGADRKFSDNKFFGWAIRYGNGRSNIVNTKQNIHMDSLTLNLYGVMPKDKEKYLNAVLGLSALKIDSHYLGKKSAQRYGKQLFTAIDFRTKNTYSKLNLTPTTKLTFGITRLGEYTDFISDAISPAQNIRYHEDTFTSGQISSGFLFETDQIIINDKTFQPMGGMEFYYDLTSDIDYDYSLVGSNQVNTDTINGAYSVSNLRTRLGFELIYPDGLTLSPMYEKTFAIKGSPLNYDDFIDKAIAERFIIKISRSKETDGNNFALDFDPLNQNYANISFNKNLGNLNFKLNSNYSLYDKIPDYGANLEISGTF